MAQQTLLMVEDSLSMAAIYKAYLKDSDYQIRIVTDLDSARIEFAQLQPDIVLLDVELPDGSGLSLIDEIKQDKTNHTEIIIMTAHGSSDMAVKAIDDGAFDFLTKPFDASRLRVTIENARKHQLLHRKVSALAELDRDRYCNFIGKSLAMQSVYRIIDSLAASSATAFIIGESGTGKELAAEAIHQQSDRSQQAFHAINCGAIPNELMESELFGHVKGAFTGATVDRLGAASIADKGTLFLDEICEMDLELQKKLLRFLQTGTFQKVGSNQTEHVDIRIVCATNKDPMEEVRAGHFREDLYYRLHVVPLHLPPLRMREGDVELLAEYFLKIYAEKDNKQFNRFTPAVIDVLNEYHWPGNIRQLQNIIQNIVVLNNGEQVDIPMLPAPLNVDVITDNQPIPTTEGIGAHNTTIQPSSKSYTTEPTLQHGEIEPLWVTEKRVIQRAVDLCGGSINKAAGKLEVAPSTIYRKMQSWNTPSTASAN